MPKEKTQNRIDYLPEEPTKKHGVWMKNLLLFILIILSIVMLFQLGDYLSGDSERLSFGELLHHINYPLLGILFCAVLLYFVVESGKYSFMLKKYTGKFRFLTSVKTMFIGKFYDGITPLSTGGQPFQICYLHKKDGIPNGPACAIPVMRYIVNISVLTIVSIVLLALAPRLLGDMPVTTKTLLIVSWVSLGINVSFPVMIVLFSIFPRPCKKFVIRLIGLLKKLHLVKNPYKATIKFVRELTEYSEELKKFGKEIYKFIPLILLSMAETFLFLTLPLLTVCAIGNVPLSFDLAMQVASLVIITRYSALLIPTPGNTGAAEAAGSLVFITVEGIDSVIGWVVLTWRFLTYYLYLLIGTGINLFEIIRNSVRAKRVKRAEKH